MREPERKKRKRTNLEPSKFFPRGLSPEKLSHAKDYVQKALETPDSWLASLPTFECPVCGDETIFKSGCPGCFLDVEVDSDAYDDTQEGDAG